MYDTQAMLEGLNTLFTIKTLVWLSVGFVLGFIVGAIPGFSDANFMAIMLPFTILLEPMIAIVCMSALYMSAQAAGSIPAILINIPGTGGTAASVLEGYPMAKQGKAGFALGISLTSSTIGGLAGALFALLVAPILGAFAFRFGPAEICMIGIFGMTVVGSLTSEKLSKGMLATVLGVLISLVGADSMAGYSRGTFGILELEDGLPLIPTLLGLFGFSEIIFLMRQSFIASETTVISRGWKEIFQGVREALRHRTTLVRSSILGEIIGIIPGVGAAVSGFYSYGQAKQWSKEPEKFGTGHPDGLVATDTANNATVSGAIVPLLTLGLPGSASTMVMLAALMMHGVRPGPRFFLNFQTEAYTILFSLFLSAILIFITGVPLARYARSITFMPTQVLVPIVGVLLFVGAFAWRFLTFDIMLMIVFGILGVFLRLYGYPTPAVLLAIILGPMVERNFLRAIRIGGLEIFFQGPILFTLWALILISILGPFLLELRRKRSMALKTKPVE
jgi:putative tricarboxylic transport membrane protein